MSTRKVYRYNAEVVQNLVDQGAIILAKTNLDEFAILMLGLSSVSGQTRNVYLLDNGPGGSSGGSASAVSANLAMVGLGTDTGGSIRIPASLAGLIGIRPTQALANLDGIAPLSITQDTVGPMCRTIRDCAYILSYIEAYSTSSRQQQIVNALDKNGLKNTQIAMITDMFPPRTADNKSYWIVLDKAIQQMRLAGATIDDVKLTNQQMILDEFTSLSRYQIKDGINNYLNSWSFDKDNHLSSYDAIIASKAYTPSTEPWLKLYGQINDNKEKDPIYLKNLHGRQGFIRAQLNKIFNGKIRYDAIMYPTITQLNTKLGKNTEGRRNINLSSFSGLPAITFPAGMTLGADSQPIGLELLGREFDEPTLIRIIYSYESLTHPRVSSIWVPEL